MNQLFGDKRISLLKQYKKEILIRLIISTAIYAVGVSLFFIFKKREYMYLFPILLGIYTMFYFAYLFYFILMYYSNYKGNINFINKISSKEIEFKLHHCKLIDSDGIIYRMYGVFCHNIRFFDIDDKKDISLFIPMENSNELLINGIYEIESYLSIIVNYKEIK